MATSPVRWRASARRRNRQSRRSFPLRLRRRLSRRVHRAPPLAGVQRRRLRDLHRHRAPLLRHEEEARDGSGSGIGVARRHRERARQTTENGRRPARITFRRPRARAIVRQRCQTPLRSLRLFLGSMPVASAALTPFSGIDARPLCGPHVFFRHRCQAPLRASRLFPGSMSVASAALTPFSGIDARRLCGPYAFFRHRCQARLPRVPGQSPGSIGPRAFARESRPGRPQQECASAQHPHHDRQDRHRTARSEQRLAEVERGPLRLV